MTGASLYIILKKILHMPDTHTHSHEKHVHSLCTYVEVFMKVLEIDILFAMTDCWYPEK